MVERRTAVLERREQNLASIIYGGLHPRRIQNRRPGDDQNFIVDWHDAGLFMVAMAIMDSWRIPPDN